MCKNMYTGENHAKRCKKFSCGKVENRTCITPETVQIAKCLTDKEKVIAFCAEIDYNEVQYMEPV